MPEPIIKEVDEEGVEQDVVISQFSVMIYNQIITSDDNPIVHQSTTPTFETVSATSSFYG